MASLTQWTWVWVNSGSWWWTGRPGMLQSMGLQKVGHDWETELNWTDWCMHGQSLSCVLLFATLWTVAHQALRPWDFPGKSTGVGCHCLLRLTTGLPGNSEFSRTSWPDKPAVCVCSLTSSLSQQECYKSNWSGFKPRLTGRFPWWLRW